MSHTPTPWRHIKNTGAITSETARIAEVGDFRDKQCLPHCKERWTADAKRIVACVNACEGVSTERLENDYRQGYSVHDEIKTLRRQRDTLLSVVKELEESAGYWSEYDVPLGIVDRLRQAIKECQE